MLDISVGSYQIGSKKCQYMDNISFVVCQWLTKSLLLK